MAPSFSTTAAVTLPFSHSSPVTLAPVYTRTPFFTSSSSSRWENSGSRGVSTRGASSTTETLGAYFLQASTISRPMKPAPTMTTSVTPPAWRRLFTALPSSTSRTWHRPSSSRSKGGNFFTSAPEPMISLS